MDGSQAPVERTRLATWPLIAFLINLLILFPGGITQDSESTDILAVGLLMGTAWALAGLIAAAVLNSRLGPTKTALPFVAGSTWRSALFCVCGGASLLMKIGGLYGLVSMLLGVIALYSVMRASSVVFR